MSVKKWDMAKVKRAYRHTKRWIRRILRVIETIHRYVWLRRVLKASKWLLRFTWLVLQKLTWPIWSPIAFIVWVLKIFWAFVWGKKSRAAQAQLVERNIKKEEKRQKRLRRKPYWRDWFGLPLLFYHLKAGLIKIVVFLFLPWTFLLFLMKRLWDAKNFVGECHQDKRDAKIERSRVLAEEEAKKERLAQQAIIEEQEDAARRNQLAEVLKTLENF